MNNMSRLFDLTKKYDDSGCLPANWKQALHRCNLFMARRGISTNFLNENQQADAGSNQLIWNKEIADGWRQFSANPTYETAVRFLAVAPNMFPYFEESFQKSLYPATLTASTFSLEHYRLQSKLDDIKELREFSQKEYVLIPRQFKNEVIYNAPPINFLGREWKCVVSSVHGIIYRWEASLEVRRDEDADSICNEVIKFCIRWLGATTDEIFGYLFWDISDGNVSLQLVDMDDWLNIIIRAISRETCDLIKI